MKTMAYNLLYGAFENEEYAGVKKDWQLYKDPEKKQPDIHPLPENWKSSIQVMKSNILKHCIVYIATYDVLEYGGFRDTLINTLCCNFSQLRILNLY